jgi:hypothetical protein
MLKARLHPHWVGGKAGYLYSVIFDGKLLVERSRDPQFEAARALLAQGITGKLTLLDGKTGKPRIMVDIEKAAQLRTYDDSRGIGFERWKAFQPLEVAFRSAAELRGSTRGRGKIYA